MSVLNHRILRSILVIMAALLLQVSLANAEETVESGVNRPGRDYKDFVMEPSIAGFAPCQAACRADSWCRAWTFVAAGIQGPKAHCWLKKSVPDPVPDNCCVSGVSGVITGLEFDANRPGKDYKDFAISNVDLRNQAELICKRRCDEDSACRAWTYVKPAREGADAHCWLKNDVPARQSNNCCISGVSANSGGGGQVAPQEISDRNPTGKTFEQCEAAFQRNMTLCTARFGGNFAAKIACDAEVAQIRAACFGLAQANANAGGGVPAEWADMLQAHNDKRTLHCVPPLTWSARLAAEAQTWANECTISHSDTADGENLAHFVPSGTNGQAFQDSWYCEIQHYDFDNPQVVGGRKKACDPPVNGHFTQIVWKDSRELGCAKKECNGGIYWVCRYSPPGNFNAGVISNLRQQVLPPTCR